MTIKSIDNSHFSFSSHCNGDVATKRSRIVRDRGGSRTSVSRRLCSNWNWNLEISPASRACLRIRAFARGARDRRPVASAGVVVLAVLRRIWLDAMAGWNSKMFRIPVEKSKLRRIRSFQVRHAFHHLKKVPPRKILRHSRNPRNCTCKHDRRCP